jgi:hypothetical protein
MGISFHYDKKISLKLAPKLKEKCKDTMEILKAFLS